MKAGVAVRWVNLPPVARYPVELLGWSPDSRSVAFRARGVFEDKVTPLFVASADALSVKRRAATLTVGNSDAGPYPHEPAAIWANAQHLLVRGRNADATRDDWWLAGSDAAPVNLTAGLSQPPEAFRRTHAHRLVAVAGNTLLALDLAAARLLPVSGISIPTGASIVWPQDAARPSDTLLVTTSGKDGQTLHRIALTGVLPPARVSIPAGAELLSFDHGAILCGTRRAPACFCAKPISTTQLGAS